MNYLYCFYCNFIIKKFKIKGTIFSTICNFVINKKFKPKGTIYSKICSMCNTKYFWYYENNNTVLSYIDIPLNNDLTFCFDFLKNDYLIYQPKKFIYSPIFESHDIGNIIHLSIQEIKKKFLNLLPFI